MQSLVTFPNFKPFKRTSGYDLYVFLKEDVENILKNWHKEAQWKLMKVHKGKVIRKSGYHHTAIVRQKAPAPMREYFESTLLERPESLKTLYHGCGKDRKGRDLLAQHGAVSLYDPHHPVGMYGIIPNQIFDEIHSHYVLNVVTKDEGQQIMTEIYGRLSWKWGQAVVSVRRDL